MKLFAKILVVPVLAFGLVSFYACGGSSDDDKKKSSSGTNLTYSDVSAAITAYCVASGCHSEASSASAGGHDLSDYAGVSACGATCGASISGGSMPQAGSAQRTSWDAEDEVEANLIEYFNNGTPE